MNNENSRFSVLASEKEKEVGKKSKNKDENAKSYSRPNPFKREKVSSRFDFTDSSENRSENSRDDDKYDNWNKESKFNRNRERDRDSRYERRPNKFLSGSNSFKREEGRSHLGYHRNPSYFEKRKYERNMEQEMKAKEDAKKYNYNEDDFPSL